MCRKLLFSLSLALMALTVSAQIRINEFMASNASAYADENGLYGDWVELYNTGPDAVNLEGYFLSDDLGLPTKWGIPAGTVLDPSEFLIIWVDSENNGLHASFKLSSQAEELGLFSPDTLLLDSVSFFDQISDYSYGRSEAELASWGYYNEATPGMPNSGDFISKRCKAPVLDLPPGIYNETQRVPVINREPGASLYYTTDGSLPDENSSLAGGRITTFNTMPLRIRAYKEGYLPSRVVTNTYLIGEEKRNIAIVSLATDPDNLWDDEMGIHVVGTNGIDKFNIVANYNQDWERPISVEMFESEGGRAFQVNAGVKIFGQYSRKKEHKSLAFYMRSKYGNGKLNYRLFPDKDIDQFNNFLLRNGGNEWEETLFGDAISQYVIKDMTDVDYMAYRPVAVFLNGDYWGILNLREKINEHYASSNYGLAPDEVDMLENQGDADKWIVSGSNADYMALRTYIENNNLAVQSAYEHVASEVNVEQYTDYQMTEIYENNTDWPGNNKKYWRHSVDPDSKWRWVLYDVDRGFSIRAQAPDYKKNDQDNLVRAMTSGKWNFILPGLMQNEAYKAYFIKRFNAHINTTFHPDRVHPMFDDWRDMLEPEMERHIDQWLHARWDVSDIFDEQSIEGWRGIVDYKKYWAEERPAVMMGILRDYFSLGDTFRVEFSVNVPEGGSISVNGLKSSLPAFSGTWFEDYDIQLEAHPEPGYRFVEWEGVALGKSNPEYNLSVTEDRSIKAIFDSYELVINEIMADNKAALADSYGEYDDWIEIYNSGSSAIDLGGMYLSDSVENLLLWQIPDTYPDSTTLEAGKSLILWADAQPEQGVLHLGFKLNSGGETITLTGNDGSSIQSMVTYDNQYPDRSWGSYPDASDSREYMPATPGDENTRFAQDWPIVINEYMASNSGTIQDEFEEYDDWIELYNTGAEVIDVGGLFLTDDLNNPVKYRIPEGDPENTSIEPGGFLLVWADNDDEQGPLHTNFKLSAEGEELGLAEPGGKYYLDTLVFSTQEVDLSHGRTEDGTGLWSELSRATPGRSNIGVGIFIPEDLGIAVYPNPFSGELNIDPGYLSGEEGILMVYDVQGRLVYREDIAQLSPMQIDLSAMQAGVYFLKIHSLEEIRIYKLLKH